MTWFIKLSANSAKQFAQRVIPRPAKAALVRLRARILSRGLSRNRVAPVGMEYVVASASMSIIVPIHDAPAVTKRCLASLERDATKAEIILVDDASRMPETIDAIREFSNRNGWRVIRHEQPKGHSVSCAAGARLASRPYLCLLNSDTVVTPWCWHAIQQAVESDPSIGVAGPCTSHSGTEQTLDIATKCRFYWDDKQISAFAERLAAAPFHPPISDLPWIGGFAFFIRRTVWEQLGGFDPNLKDYSNEIELCTRVTNAGYRIVWARSGYIHHFGGQSYDLPGHEIRLRATAGYLYMRDKHKAQRLPSGQAYTQIVRSADGKSWMVRSNQGTAR